MSLLHHIYRRIHKIIWDETGWELNLSTTYLCCSLSLSLHPVQPFPPPTTSTIEKDIFQQTNYTGPVTDEKARSLPPLPQILTGKEISSRPRTTQQDPSNESHIHTHKLYLFCPISIPSQSLHKIPTSETKSPAIKNINGDY